VGSHLGYFIHGEHHLHSVRLLILLLTAPICIFVVIARSDEHISNAAAGQKTGLIVVSYLGSLTTSILIYRVFAHPLRNFPGPFVAKLTKLSHVIRLARSSDNYLQADRLHKIYGDIVRQVSCFFKFLTRR
jgi:tryprostatin B 6-hydroxylase